MLEVCWCFQRLRWPLVLALLAMKVDYRAWTYKKQIFILLLATNHSTISRELQSMVILFTNLKQKTTQIHGLPTDKEKDNSKAIKFHPVKKQSLDNIWLVILPYNYEYETVPCMNYIPSLLKTTYFTKKLVIHAFKLCLS